MRHHACGLLAALGLAAAPAAWALPTEVSHQNADHCDPLAVPASVHELGESPTFDDYPEERIRVVSTFVTNVACPSAADPGSTVPNAAVQITNDTGVAWSDLWYVGDPGTAGAGAGTTFANFDGVVNGGLAFKIDRQGVNQPLLSESMTADEIFEVGETWLFIIDDYTSSLGLPADAIDSIGVGGLSAGGQPSSGSIIARRAVPEPAALVLVAAYAAARASRRRNQR